jgi:mycofactocin precursor
MTHSRTTDPRTTDPRTTGPNSTTIGDRASGGAPGAEAGPDTTQLVESDLLVEEISIDGMCGVY